MRGLIGFIAMIAMAAVLLVIGGGIMEILAPIVIETQAVQALGWQEHVLRIERVLLAYIPALLIGVGAAWAVFYYLRRERRVGTTMQRRR